MLKVLGRITSINVRKVAWALDEMGVAYEREDWGKPNRDPNVPEFLGLNPNAQVPVIIDDGFVLWESHAIMRYLAREQRSGLWPADPKERALVDQWMSWQSTELNPAWGYVRAALSKGLPNPDPVRVEESIRAWTKEMRILEAQLHKTSGHVAGGAFSLADIIMGLSTHRWMSMPFDKPVLPAVEAHYRQMQSRPAGKAYMGATTP